jgi:type IV fimbrial biogenesis protein FimT
MRTNGFYLSELLVTLAVFAIVLCLCIPSFGAQIHKTQVKTATLALLNAIELARTRAVFANRRVTLAKLSQWDQGWEVFVDTNNNGVRDGQETSLVQQEPLTGIRITANNPIKNYVSYLGSGESRNANGTTAGAFQAGTFKLCPNTRGPGYKLILARGGRVRMSDLSVQDCSTQ